MPISTSQQQALKEMLSILVDRLKLNAEPLLTAMHVNGVINYETYDVLRKRQVHQSNDAVVIDCIQHIKIAEVTQNCNTADGSAWKFLVEFLKNHHCAEIADGLEARADAAERRKREHSSLPARVDVRPDAAATSSCNISSREPTPFACVQQLQKHLVDDYLERLSTLTVFPSNDQFAKLQLDATYVTLRMVRLHETWDSTVTEIKHIRYQQDVPGLIRETSTLLEQLLAPGRGHELPPQPMLILGDPGQGKTTFAQKLAYDWAMAQKCAASATPLLKEITLLLAFPFPRNLSGKYEQIFDFVLSPKLFGSGNSNIIGSLEVVKNWIRKNPTKVVVVLDGLDEMNIGDCTQLNEVLSKKPLRSPDVPLIITTRPYAIPKECPWALRFEICPLTPRQASEIVEKYFSTRTPESVKRSLSDFCLADENSFLQSSPLLLHLLCGTVFRMFVPTIASNAPEIQLPRSQTKCYIEIIRWIFERARETKKEKLENFSLEAWIKGDTVKRLCELAFDRTFSKSNDRDRLVFDRRKVDEKLGLLTEDAMRTGYLVADSLYYGYYEAVSTNFKLSFTHKTFQEFFAAVEIVSKLEKDEDIETLIGDDVKSRQEILFAIGVACETKSRAVGKLFDFVLRLVHRKLSSVLNKYDYNDATFVLGFLKALFRETTDEDQHKALKQFAKQNSAEFEHFAVNHFYQYLGSYGSSFLEIADGLFPIGAGFPAYEAVDVSGHHFVLSRRANEDGKWILVVDITAKVAGISKAQVKEIQASNFHFSGTLSGLSIFLSAIGVLSNMAIWRIMRSPLKLPTHLTTRSLDGDAFKSMKSSFNVIGELWLSSQLDAREVRNVFEFLSTTRAPPDKEVVKIENLWFWYHEEATEESGDVRPTATNVDDLSAYDESITISVNTLHVARFAPEVISSRSLSVFAAILNCVQEIDRIMIGDSGLALIDEFEKEPNERRLEGRVATIQEINWDADRYPPSGSLAKFVADVKAKKLTICSDSSSVISIESFVDFCKILAEHQNNRRVMLQEIEMKILQEVQPLISAIVDSLVGLLRLLRNLKLNLVCHLDKDDIKFVRSLFPAELLDRASVL